MKRLQTVRRLRRAVKSFVLINYEISATRCQMFFIFSDFFAMISGPYIYRVF